MKTKTHSVEIKHLRAFEAVARMLSFTRAAQEIDVAQSALSKQIRELESYLGVELFLRSRVKVSLTESGRAYLPYVNKILVQLDIAATAAVEATKTKTRQLRMATDWRVTHPYVMGAIVAFKKEYPNIDLDIQDMPMPDQVDAFREGGLDIVFLPQGKFNADEPVDEILCNTVMRNKRISGILETPYAKAKMSILISPLHSLGGRDGIKISELSRERWLTMDGRDSNGYREFTRSLCKVHGDFVPNFCKEAKSMQSLIGMVGNQEGIALVPSFVLPVNTPMVKAIPTNLEPITYAAVCSKENSDNKLVRAFLDFLVEQSQAEQSL